MTKRIIISELNVGDILPDYCSAQGIYSNLIVKNINTTKKGRFNIKVTGTWKGFNGNIIENSPFRISHSAIIGTKYITIKI